MIRTVPGAAAYNSNIRHFRSALPLTPLPGCLLSRDNGDGTASTVDSGPRPLLGIRSGAQAGQRHRQVCVVDPLRTRGSLELVHEPRCATCSRSWTPVTEIAFFPKYSDFSYLCKHINH